MTHAFRRRAPARASLAATAASAPASPTSSATFAAPSAVSASGPAPTSAASHRAPSPSSRLAPLGALAAGFGVATLSLAQTAAQPSPQAAAKPATPAASAPAQAPAVAVAALQLPDVEIRAKLVSEDRHQVRATTTTIGKGHQEIRDIPQSLSVVTEKLIDDRKIDTLNQALRLTAGVTFSAAENGTMQDTFIRGFSVAQVGDLLIDGMKDPSMYDRDAFNYDRIEVLRGSASMLFGRGSTGGVVNQVMKKPMLADVSEVVLTAGTGNYLRGTVDFNQRLGEQSALRINAMATKAGNGGAKIEKNGIAPSYSWGIGSADEFTVGLFHLNVNNTPMNNSPYALLWLGGVDPSDFRGAASDFQDGSATYASLRHVHRFGENSELTTQVRSGVFERAQWNSTFRLAPGTDASNFGPGTTFTRVGLTPRHDRYRGTYLQSDFSRAFDAFGVPHALLAGVDAAHETADRFTSSNVAANFAKGSGTIGNPDDGYRSAVNPEWAPSSGYRSNAVGAYVQDLVQVLPHWKLLGGLRWDAVRGHFDTVLAGGTASATMSASVFSHRLGVLFQPTPASSYHLSYGTSFNTSGDTYQFASAVGAAAGAAAQAAAIARNAATPPEKSRNVELGAKHDWFDGQFSTRVALFRTEKYNERTTDADFAGDAYLLSGKRHSAGVELELSGRPTPQTEVYFSYAYVPVSKIDKAGSAALNTVGQPFGLLPKSSGSAWVTCQLTPALRVGAGLTGSSENYSINGASPTRGAKAPGYVIADALVEYRFTPDLYAQVNVSNIGDKVYASELYRGFTTLGAGRAVKLTVGMTY